MYQRKIILPDSGHSIRRNDQGTHGQNHPVLPAVQKIRFSLKERVVANSSNNGSLTTGGIAFNL